MMANSLITNRAPTKAEKTEAIEDALAEPGPRGIKVADGETAGYRDGKKGVVETRNFADGWLPEGWEDTPAKCKNARDRNGIKRIPVAV